MDKYCTPDEFNQTASLKSQRKRLDWNDYFNQRSERENANKQIPQKQKNIDVKSFQYCGQEL